MMNFGKMIHTQILNNLAFKQFFTLNYYSIHFIVKKKINKSNSAY